MKNILTTAGVAAVAVAGFSTTCGAQAITVDDSKWWQVSASLRGFYDDNYNTAPNDIAQESFGFEVRPGFEAGHKGEQHIIKLTTIYSARWFEDRTDEEWDHTVIADLAGEYQFNESHAVRLNNTFSYTEEGLLLDAGSPVTTPLRSDASNLRNLANIRYAGQITPLVGLEVGYINTLYDFDQTGAGSFSALVDRLEHLIKGETRWTISRNLAGILGYWYESVNFTGDEFLNPALTVPGSPVSDDRNSYSHFIVAGGDYTVSPNCFISVRGGGQNVVYDNLPGSPDDWNAFGDVNTTFEYAEDSFFRVGGKYGRIRTDVIGFAPAGTDDLTLDQEAFTAYGLVSHKIMENLTARASGQAQFGEWNGGAADGDGEGLYFVGLSLTYDVNQYLAVETGYNYDRLDSDNGDRSYSRNRVFLGVRGQF